MRYGKTIETEMLKFEPEAMRAFVKYKPLKKLIAQCVHKEDLDESKSPEVSPKLSETDPAVVENDAKAMTSFIETLIEDVIAANQYYNLKFGVVESKYNELYDKTVAEIQTNSGFFCCNKRDSSILNDIYSILGEMLLLQYFASTDYNGIRKIIKKFRKVTKSTAVDNVMTIINNSPLRDITAQNDFIGEIINLYLVRLEDERTRKKHRGCFSRPLYTYETLLKQIDTHRDPEEIKTLREESMQTIINKNLAVPGKNELRDMVFRGHRVLKSRIPKRTTSNDASPSEIVADSMLIQMAFYMIPADLYSNENGEVLDSSETVLWEGELFRRFSALNQWKPRYVIVSNKRLCVFTTKYGAMKKTVLMCDLMSLYHGNTYRFDECVLLLTHANEALWFAHSDKRLYHSFLEVLKQLYSLVVLDFLKKPNHTTILSPSAKHLHSPYTPIVPSSQRDHYSQSYSTQSESHAIKYTSVTNMFGDAAQHPILEHSVVHRSRSLTNAVDLSPESLQKPEDLFLPKLEESQRNAKQASKRLVQGMYSVNSQIEIWLLLQQFDIFVHEESAAETSNIDFNTTKKREVSKIIEAIQESQASSPALWSPYLKLHAISILRWKYPDLAAILQGKQNFTDTDIEPIEVNINKLYRYERQIGEGNYSSVWVVEDKHNHTFYALKKVALWSLDAYENRALSREVYNMLLLRGHPNIVKFFGFFADSSYAYIAMELASGGRLFDYIKSRQSFTEGDAQQITRILLSAISFCHKHSVVHRDLKPQNILLSEGDQLNSIKLTDFGFSLTSSTHQLTTSLGTPGYTAPEVMRQNPYTSAVDMWSLGVITYILLCGYPPFPSDNDVERIRCISTASFQFYPNEWDTISNEAKEFIKKLIVVDPAKRLTAEEALTDPWLSKETAQVNLPRVIQGISTIQKKFELQVNIQHPKHEVRTHLVRTQVKTDVFGSCSNQTKVIGSIPADYPIEISNEVVNDSLQYGLLTEYSKTFYKIASSEAWIVLQENHNLKCTHALTYMYKSSSHESLPIFSSPLEDSVIVGNFTNPILICDTLLDIHGTHWAVLHHSMYNLLKLNGIPQAWIVLKNQEQSYFEKVDEIPEYMERLNEFRTGLNQ